VVEAVGAGITAAESIHRYLRKLDLREGRTTVWPRPEEIQIRPTQEIRLATRPQVPGLSLADRISGFQEVEQGLTAEQAVEEARRCLACGVCSECLQCVSACQRGAIHQDDQPRQLELDVDAVIVATGFDIFDPRLRPELGYGVYPQVITSLEFERLASASGPTAGKIVLNGRPPRGVVFIQCVGSRDRALGIPYCSRVCCMAVAKQAHLAHDRLPDAAITVFYMDVRACGKGFEEFYDRVRQEGVLYRRGIPSEIVRSGNGLLVRAEDTLLGQVVEVEADLVVLAAGMLHSQGTERLAQVLNLSLGEDGFLREDHPKMRTVETNVPGVFLAGCCQGPKDIPDSVAHAKAAAAAAMILLSGKVTGNAPGK
jgi:heterodisulfide reductase subunit A